MAAVPIAVGVSGVPGVPAVLAAFGLPPEKSVLLLKESPLHIIG